MNKDWLPPAGLSIHLSDPGEPTIFPSVEERLEALLLRIEPVLKKLEARLEAEASTDSTGQGPPMTWIAPDEMRDLVKGETPLNLGTLALCRPEHSCCHEVAIRRLGIFTRGDGSRVTDWEMVAEFPSKDEATKVLALLQKPQ